MSVDAKLFVTCGKEKLFDVMQSVVTRLNEWNKVHLIEVVKNSEYHNVFNFLHHKEEHGLKYTWGVTINGHDFRHFCLDFGIGDENYRSLHVFTDCSCDYSDTYEGDKIVFSIGYWGKSDEIMKQVAEAVKDFGEVYYDFNDCDEHDFVKLY